MAEPLILIAQPRWPARSLCRKGIVYWALLLAAACPDWLYGRCLDWLAAHGYRFYVAEKAAH